MSHDVFHSQELSYWPDRSVVENTGPLSLSPYASCFPFRTPAFIIGIWVEELLKEFRRDFDIGLFLWEDDGYELGVPCKIGFLLELLLTGDEDASSLFFINSTICTVFFMIYQSAWNGKRVDKVYRDETG